MNDDVRELCVAVRMAAHALPGMLTKNPLPTLDTTRSLNLSLTIHFSERLRLANLRPGGETTSGALLVQLESWSSSGLSNFLTIVGYAIEGQGLCRIRAMESIIYERQEARAMQMICELHRSEYTCVATRRNVRHLAGCATNVYINSQSQGLCCTCRKLEGTHDSRWQTTRLQERGH